MHAPGPDPKRPGLATAALLSIGDELALGQTLDTNTAWMADRLFSVGVRVVEHATVEDDLGLITDALGRLGELADLVVCTGGLGPTADDLTRQAVAGVLADELVEDPGSVAHLEKWFAGRAGGLPAINRVQALRPASASSLDNPNGTAPGIRARDDARGAEIFCLPGPPHEMKPMFERFVAPFAQTLTRGVTHARLMLTFGLGESRIAEILGDLMDRDRESRGLPVIGTTASLGVVTCRIRGTGPDHAGALRALDDGEAAIRARLDGAGAGGIVFDRRDLASGDPGEIRDALPAAIVKMLRDRGERLAVVESCTGGLLGGAVTGIAGSSDVFVGGWQTYSNEMKQAMVGVPEALLAQHGAVSAPCALAMARGALARLASDGIRCEHALSVTGIAGPGGGTDAKPVGTVWIGHAAADGTAEARRFVFRGGREAIRGWSVRAALGMLRLGLLGIDTDLLAQHERVTD
jgi:nicotinamide-nucleotide amidase